MDIECFTIGHSNRPKEEMIILLRKRKIKYLIDVRSVPYSKFAAQYNKEEFSKFLKINGIHYKYFGNMLGGAIIRFNSDNADNAESISLKDIRNSEKFRKGINIVANFLKQGKKIALMCSEKDPFECHRFFLISFSLSKLGFKVNHIISENELVNNRTLEKKLRNKFNQTTLLDFNQDLADMEKYYEKHVIQIHDKFNG